MQNADAGVIMWVEVSLHGYPVTARLLRRHSAQLDGKKSVSAGIPLNSSLTVPSAVCWDTRTCCWI